MGTPLRFLAATLAAASLLLAADPPEARIKNVESGLRHGAYVQGRAAQKFEIRARMKQLNVPGVSVVVIDGGRIDWARGYGITTEQGKPVRTETLFQAASISKPVAAMAAMRLVEQGKLSLDEDVNVKLRSWKVPENEFLKPEKVTLRRLLSHTAGLTVHGFPGYASGAAVPTLVQLLEGKSPANTKPVVADIVPGTKWRYSGGGYEVMQLLVEDVTGRPFHEVARELVLEPLGMKNSTYEQPLPTSRAGQAANGYRGDGKVVPGKWHTYPEQAAAGLWTTPSDLARVVFEMQSGGKILKSETVEAMLKPVMGNYGLGFGVGEKEGQKSFSHGGANEGFRCNLFAYRSGGRGAIVMTNSDRGAQLASEIMRSIAIEYGWPDYKPAERKTFEVPAEVLRSYAGKYQFPQVVATVTLENGRLFVQVTDMGKAELFAASPESFFTLEGGLPPLSFRKGAGGRISLSAGGRTAVRQDP